MIMYDGSSTCPRQTPWTVKKRHQKETPWTVSRDVVDGQKRHRGRTEETPVDGQKRHHTDRRDTIDGQKRHHRRTEETP
ncbi:hypothetical protein GDO86_003175 [Hymenochirus boettgeri]|uniref:Uncharacterized protein n=1 Tax=Hymenochirus boettgeri TaxID=247094 RepID=A0A8T2K4S6_9PIPI|nr:hypothetical protein GDO86_003175 [Hymenochirus boettgeri]